MTTKIRLIAMPEETGFAPLGVLGYCLTRTSFLAPVFTELALPLKQVNHAPNDKLLDVLVSILAGCRAIYQIGSRLRPDLALAQAWGRPSFASQANVARTLDAFSEESIEQLRRGSEALFRRENHSLRHNFEQDWLWLDIDLTSLPASKHAQDSAKGKISGKKPLWSLIGPGACAPVSGDLVFPPLPRSATQQPHLHSGPASLGPILEFQPGAETANHLAR